MGNEAQKKHHHLIAGTIMFRNKDSNDIGSVVLNGVLLTDTKEVPIASLGKAQQILQFNFHRNAQNDGSITVLDVIILNIVHLGLFTEEEFKAVPEGTTLQEVKVALQEAAPVAEGQVEEEPKAPSLAVVKNDAETEASPNQG